MMCEAVGARVAVSRHWQYGGEGALEFADAVIDACKEPVKFKFLYDLETPLRKRVELIAKEVYGADGVSYSAEANAKAERFEKDPKFKDYTTMMVKTHLSLSHDPTLKGVPKGWTLHIRDFLTYGGSRFICPVAGNISLMPGTSSDPAYRRVDVDTETGKVKGLF
jgi:formate--tetrahydrofolate ligase